MKPRYNYKRTKYKYKINWGVLGLKILTIVCWIIVILLLCYALGCSTMKQSAVFTNNKVGASIKLSNSKTSFMYWSKYQARVDTFGLSTEVYNAEGRPDPNSVEAAVKGATKALLMLK